MAGHRSVARAQARLAARGGRQQRRDQHQPRHRTGLGRPHRCGLEHAAPFWLNAISNLGVIAALSWWRSPQKTSRALPAERFFNANRIGLRYARHNPHLRATLGRAVAFFLFASAYWALLPLVARDQIGGGPELYGLLLGAIGAGALIGAFALPWLRAWLGPDRLVAAGTLGTVLALTLYGLSREPHRARREPRRRRVMDRRSLLPQRLRPGRPAGMGARGLGFSSRAIRSN